MSRKSAQQQAERDRENEYMVDFLARLSKVSTVEEARSLPYSPRLKGGAVGHRRHANLAHLLGGLKPTGATPPYRLVRDYPLCPSLATLEERGGYRDLFIRFCLNREIEQADIDTAVMKLSGRDSA